MGAATSTPGGPSVTTDDGGWYRRPAARGAGGSFGPPSDVVEAGKVDAMSTMWQRALRAKTAALDELRERLEAHESRLEQMELERTVMAEADAHAEATVRASAEADVSRRLALASTSSVLTELRRQLDGRAERVDALMAAVRTCAERSHEHELAVREAHRELAERSAYFAAAESFLREQLAESSSTVEALEEELGAGEEAMLALQAQFEATLEHARANQRRVTTEAETHRSRMLSTLEESEREAGRSLSALRGATDAAWALQALREIADGLVVGPVGTSGRGEDERAGAGRFGVGSNPGGGGGGGGKGKGRGGQHTGVEPALVEAVTAALGAAQAERSALIRENQRIREETAAEVAALRSALIAAAEGNAAKAAVFLMEAGGSESDVAAVATATALRVDDEDSDDSRDGKEDAAGEGEGESEASERGGKHRRNLPRAGARDVRVQGSRWRTRKGKFETDSAQEEAARGGLAAAEEKLAEMEGRTSDIDAMREQLHLLKADLYEWQPKTPRP